MPSRDWRDEPMVEFNLLSDPRDLERMMDGVRRFGAMHLTPTMQAVTAESVPRQLQRQGPPGRAGEQARTS